MHSSRTQRTRVLTILLYRQEWWVCVANGYIGPGFMIDPEGDRRTFGSTTASPLPLGDSRNSSACLAGIDRMDVVVIIDMMFSITDGQPGAYTEAGTWSTWEKTPFANIACSHARRTYDLLCIRPFEICDYQHQFTSRNCKGMYSQDDRMRERTLNTVRCFCCNTMLVVGDRKCPMCDNGTPPRIRTRNYA